MLWNPENDLFTLYSLRDWMATRPADEPYVWIECSKCVVGKYLEAHGQHNDTAEYARWIIRTPGAEAIHKCFNEYDRYNTKHEATMGSALKRLDEYMANQVMPKAA